MKYIILLLFICSLFMRCKDDEIKQGVITVDNFYVKIENEDYIGMDSLMSFKFYQNTPYKDFKVFLNKKNKDFGELEGKTLKKFKIIKTSTLDTIHLGYEVNYKNISTKESFTLIEENEDFKIIKYYISTEE